MRRTFPSVQLRLLVGIGGGIPSQKNDIRLGNVVVGKLDGIHGGVVQYDLGKRTCLRVKTRSKTTVGYCGQRTRAPKKPKFCSVQLPITAPTFKGAVSFDTVSYTHISP